MLRVGIISDTHGLVRPEAKTFLQGCDFIVHAGDICEQRVLDELQGIAPLTVVRGNNDIGPWAQKLCEIERVKFEGVALLAIHDLARLHVDLRAEGIRVVVSGHSHKPLVQERDGVLFVNPGSAGPRRFTLPISIGELHVDGTSVTARTVTLVGPHAS